MNTEDTLENALEDTIAGIKAPDPEIKRDVQSRWDSIAKPLHGLGLLEDMVSDIAAAQGTTQIDIRRRALVTFCADNGVVAEGVTQTGQEVTANVAENFLTGNATASILCKRAGTDHFPVDIGMAKRTSVPDRRIAAGTQDLLYGPAMTRAQAVQGIVTGIGIAEELAQKGYRILAAGEMGIGNTTTSSAMASVLLDKDPEEVTGRGAGLDSQGLARKIEVIRESLRVNHPDPADPIDILACEGGFDIAGMTGLFLGGAACRVPVVCDGFISAVAALTAVRICREAAGYVFASHLSEEPAAAMILEALHKQAPIRCGMHLGEGTGAVMLFPLLDMALDVYHGMPTFADIEIEQYKELK